MSKCKISRFLRQITPHFLPSLVQEKDNDPTRRYRHVQEETKPIKTQPNGRVSGGSVRNRDEMQKRQETGV